MDIVEENQGLILHYKKYGFDFLGLSKLENTLGLPVHYLKATVSFFQMHIWGITYSKVKKILPNIPPFTFNVSILKAY